MRASAIWPSVNVLPLKALLQPQAHDKSLPTSRRAGKKRGKQPMWLSTMMRYHIQPVIKRLGITKQVSWHTFRRTYATLLQANREDVKVVQELLRHGSSKVTLDVYSQAQMSDKRVAQRKVVELVRQEGTQEFAAIA